MNAIDQVFLSQKNDNADLVSLKYLIARQFVPYVCDTDEEAENLVSDISNWLEEYLKTKSHTLEQHNNNNL